MANGLFHALHLSIILFVMVGWMFSALLELHLVLMLLTLASWFILGRWLGFGYCPISDGHWTLKQTLGEGRPRGSYIHYVMQKASGRALDESLVNKGVLIGTVLIFALSLVLNLQTWR